MWLVVQWVWVVLIRKVRRLWRIIKRGRGSL